MSIRQFKCTLETDVILNQKSASEGPNVTLDFIPGNCFLGIVASEYDNFKENAWKIFHSGKVKFGDAHPILNGVRTLRAAASFFHPKLNDRIYYNFHLMDNHEGQYVQCRTDFYDYQAIPPQRISPRKSFAVKSAYDRELRRSKDGQMFGYESLSKGSVLLFEVYSEDEPLLKDIEQTLIGVKRIGRSRSAQYGLVRIERAQYEEIQSTDRPLVEGLYTVYADSRLIFMDSFGLPCCQPTAHDLGFGEDAKILWEKSQIRTFQYAPYNWKRKCFDVDRYGIEKGAVFVVEASSSPSQSSYVGCYQNEGFGKVIYNAPFLTEKSYTLPDVVISPSSNPSLSFQIIEQDDTALIITLKNRHNETLLMTEVYLSVNQWIEKNSATFKGERMASQWGEIRAIATRCGITGDDVATELEAFISHGVAKTLWEKRTRKILLLNYIKDVKKKQSLSGKAWLAVSTLAAEMHKIVAN